MVADEAQDEGTAAVKAAVDEYYNREAGAIENIQASISPEALGDAVASALVALGYELE